MIAPAQYYAMLARTNPSKRPPTDAVPLESELHADIESYCRAKGWYFVHSRMDRRSTNGIGVADFLVFMDKGKFVAIEAKRSGRKPTKEQLNAQAQLRHLGHVSEICYTFRDFLTAVNQAMK